MDTFASDKEGGGMSAGPEGGVYHTSEDERLLHRLGYAQELRRGMRTFSRKTSLKA